MKFCLYQGTFNPIHNAHIQVAQFVLGNFGFNKIIFIPAYKPPHKNGDNNNIDPIHRLNMVESAIKNHPHFEVSDIEYKRESTSYTYLTIVELYKQFNLTEKICFIIGTDAFSKIESWYKADELKELVHFIVFVRENDFDEKPLLRLKEKGYNYTLAEMPFIDISSSEVREKVNKNIDIYDIVPKGTADYIKENELYRS